MIRNAFTGESWTAPKSIAQQTPELTAEDAAEPVDVKSKRQAQAEAAEDPLLRAATADSASSAHMASPAR